jgi:hypothetical protein
VHARELSAAAEHEAEKLSDAGAKGAVIEKKRKAVALADRIGSALGQLQTAPGDSVAARTAERQLDGLSRQASDLAQSL